MGRTYPQLVTVNEAVGLLVNMHTYIDEEYSLYDILGYFKEEAEVEYENAEMEAAADLAKLELRKLACESRYHLARNLEECLKYEVRHPKDSDLKIKPDETGKPRITWKSLSDWGANRFGIEIAPPDNPKETPKEKVRWEKVKVKIWSDHQIGYSVAGSTYKRKYFSQIGLMDSRKKHPNRPGLILIGLSKGRNFGISKKGSDSVAMSRLREALKDWIGGIGDPFLAHNEAEGWAPRFKLIDNSNSRDARAAKEAEKRQVSYDDSLNYEDQVF